MEGFIVGISTAAILYLIVTDPLLFLHEGIFDQCDHGVSATKGKQPDLREGQKRSRIIFISEN